MLPTVSLIVPCYNEEKRIRHLLDALLAQTYPLEQMDVTIADGLSQDRTRLVIAEFQRQHPLLRIQVIDNNAKNIPAALNRAIEASTGEMIVRLDAHSAPYPGYVEQSVAALLSGTAENVGGVWEIRPGAEGWLAESIAVAAAHPLGVGDALYRHAKSPAYVDTVPFGAFRRLLLEKVGKFDESLLANEDYEFNARIRQSGGRVWLNPQIRSVYFARATLADLARQYWRYGLWKWQMLRRYPATLRWRQALPPLFVLSVLTSLILSPFFNLFSWLLLFLLAFYVGFLLAAGLHRAIQQRKLFLLLGLPLSIATMHFSWGVGFLWSILFGVKQP
ncbi:MAG: glycosyltransferase family 2 protein [Anaerolineales bacterium]|jgi:glycosyltransferase involved in cell wall biosynthesis|nr:glycosyltransferase family 2 protein [Anaerolineales bacterium]